MQRIVVVGASGFLGRALLKELEGKPVLALTSNPNSLSTKDEVEVISYENFLSSNMNLQDSKLINLAYRRSSDPEVAKENISFTERIFKKAEELGVASFINISSQSVYDGARKEAAKEEDLVSATTLYDIGKYYLENWIRDFSKKHSTSYINLRLASLVGPNFEKRITSRLVKQGLADGVIEVVDNGTIFSYAHVKDVARGIVASLNLKDSYWNRTYNLGTMESYTITQLAETIKDVFQRSGLELEIKCRTDDSPSSNNSIDTSLFEGISGWSPNYHLESILLEELAHQQAIQQQ